MTAAEPLAEAPAAHEAERAYTLANAAEIKDVSEQHLRRAIKSTGPHFLKAKLVGGKYRVSASDLDDWYRRLPDA